MARKDIKTLSLYPSNELIQSLEEFKISGEYKSLSAAAIAILSQHLISNPESTVQSTVPDESPNLSTVQTKVQSTVLDDLKAEIRQLTSRVETLENQSTVQIKVQSEVQDELPTTTTVQTKVQSTVLDTQTSLKPESLPIIEAIETAAATVASSNDAQQITDKEAIAATIEISDREKELCTLEYLSLSEAYELAKLRGCTAKTEKSFNSNFIQGKYSEKFDITSEKYFDSSSGRNKNRYKNSKQWVSE